MLRVARGNHGRRAWLLGWVAVPALLLAACAGPPAPQWQEEGAYRWRELAVPGRGRVGFTALPPSQTRIEFANSVSEEQVLENEHVLNGSGVALGDVDGDGLIDVYFARLDGPNALYRNVGRWRFEDVTERAGVAAPDRLSTGVTLADVDGDGDLDLLVTAIGGPSAFFVNDGTGVFQERTAEAGLSSDRYGTTMALADVDGDGDLDLYVANNKTKPVRDMYPPSALQFERVVEQVGEQYEVRPEFRDHYRLTRHQNRLMRFEYAEPDRFYLNDGSGGFAEVSFTSGAFLDESGRPLAETPTDWGLTARFQDVDNDGDPDLYVCNDFESPDRFWINDGTGRFRAIDRTALRVTSNATMAVDFGDVNRDGNVDFLLLDMLDRRNRLRKSQVSAMQPEPPLIGEIENRPQIGRNTLQLSRGDGTFAEIARFARVEASGWSWSVLFLDVDLDGYEDILIGNGHEHDFMDSDTRAMIRRTGAPADWRRTRLQYPRLHTRNVAFHNRGDLTFDEVGEQWGFGVEEDVSQGAAVGDLDGDGDLDVVINRLGAPAAVYRNDGVEPRLAVRLVGEPPNTRGVGANIRVLGGPVPEQTREVIVGGLYVSSSDPAHAFATGGAQALTVVVDWRSGKRSVIEGARPNRLYEIRESAADAPGSPGGASPEASTHAYFRDVSEELRHVHVEEEYDDFRRQPLLRHRLSQLGPGITWLDVDRDGDEDLLIGTGQGGTLALYRNDRGRLRRVTLRMPPATLDQTTVLGLPGTRSILVGQMNYEAISPQAATEAPSVLRMDLGDITGAVVVPRITPAVPGAMSSTGPLAMADWDGDGDLDLFVGGRVLPARYPMPPTSRMYRNDEDAFTLDDQATAVVAGAGMVSGALFSDVDADGDPDLLLAVDWGSPRLYLNSASGFEDATSAYGLADYRSMWNGITAGDFDANGLPDLVVTSWGRNTELATDRDHPLLLYHADFDGNGTMDVVEARYDSVLGDLTPVRSRIAFVRGIPAVGRRVTTFREYAEATLQDLLGSAVANATVLQVDTFDHLVFMNHGDRFAAVPLPPAAQMAPSFYAGVADYDGDGREDVFMTQNFYPTEPEMSRYAAGRGLWLRGDGGGGFTPVAGAESGIEVYGDQRGAALADYDGDGRVDLAVSQNANRTVLYRNEGAAPGLRVRLEGPRDNADAVGAQVRVLYADTAGPVREIRSGSGYWSLDGATQVLGLAGVPRAVWVRWPDGSESTTDLEPGTMELTIRMPR